MAWRKPSTLRDWFGIVIRHKWKLALPALVIAIGVVQFGRYLPREYEAQNKFRREITSTVTAMGNRTIRRSLNAVRQETVEDLKSKEMLAQLIDDLNLSRGWPRDNDGKLTRLGEQMQAEKINELRENLRFRYPLRRGNVDHVVVIYTGADRELAPKVVNRLVDNYVRKTRESIDETITNNTRFFEEQVDRYKSRVQTLEREKLRFEMAHPGLQPDNPAGVANRLIAMQSQREALMQELGEMVATRDSLAAYVAGQPEMRQVTQQAMNPKLASLQKQYEKMLEERDQYRRMGMKAAHPKMQKVLEAVAMLEREMEAVDKFIEGGVRLEPNIQREEAIREVEQMAGQITAKQSQLTQLEASIKTYDDLNRNFFAKREEYQTINRELSQAVENFNFWDEKYRAHELALQATVAGQGVRLRVLEEALEAKPSSPTLVTVLGIAAVLGLGVGGLFVLVAELSDHSFHTVDQAVEDLKLPVLGAVDQIPAPGQTARARTLQWGVYPVLGAAMLMALALSTFMLHKSLTDPQRFENVGLIEFLRAYIGG